jgi:hypothetical protein
VTDDKADALLRAVETLTNKMIKVDQTLTLFESDREARDESDAAFRREVRSSLSRLETAVGELSRDVLQIRERVVEERERTDERFKLIGANGHG